MKRWISLFVIALTVSAMTFLSGCGGGGGSSDAAAPADSSGDTETTITSPISKAIAVGGDGDEVVTQGDESVDSMEIAKRVSVVDSKEDALKSKFVTFAKSIARAISDDQIEAWADTVDYKKDVTQVWVNDRTSESFGIINSILCQFDQARYDEMVNKGPYVAQVNMALCEEVEREAKQEGEGQDQVDVPEYEYWVINSYRTDDSSNQVVEAYIPNEEDRGDGQESFSGVIMARIVIYKDRVEYPPYGIFTMNFKMIPYDATGKQIDPSSEAIFRGTMKSFVNTNDETLIAFTMEGTETLPNDLPAEFAEYAGQEFTYGEKVIMATTSDGVSGRGATEDSFPDFHDGSFDIDGDTYNLAFNDQYFLRQEVGDELKCFARDNPERNVFRYGLYDVDGKRVSLSSGMPIGYDDNGKVVHGWAGFWGVHIDGMDMEQFDISNLNNMQVARFSWADDALTDETYNVKVYNGKLFKVVRKNTTLAKIKGIPLNYWDDQTGSESRVEWNGTNFVVTAVRGNNWIWDETAAGVGENLDLSALQWPDLYLWSEALNGSVRVELNGPEGQQQGLCNEPDWMNTFTFDCSQAVGSTTRVMLYTEKVVEPGSAEATALNASNLMCYNNCPDPAKLGAANEFDMYFPSWDEQNGQQLSYTYSFDSTNMELTYNNTPVVYPSDGSGWGVWVSGLVPQSTLDANPDLLDCPWNSEETCGWMVESRATEFYKWESGKDSWNKLVVLTNPRDNDSVVEFQQPLDVEYEHSFSDGSTKTYMLNYEGFGNLWGIPERCEDGETGDDIDCPWHTGEEFDGWLRVISEIAIPAGSPATYYDADQSADVDVVIKPLEEEHFLGAVAVSECSNAGLTLTDFTNDFITLEDWKDPANLGMGEIPFAEMQADGGNGVEPIVIDGVVQQQ